MQPEWKYLGWDQPFSLSFAEFLRVERDRGSSLDEVLVWVPSARTGRHVLNQLFSEKPSEVEAFHPPRLVTPAQFVHSCQASLSSLASETQCLYAWKTVLESARSSTLADLFPVIPNDQKLGWAYSVAQQLMRLRERLVEDNMNFEAVASAQLPRDAARWATLAKLEARYHEELAARNLADPADGIAALFENPLQGVPYRQVHVAGVLNLSRRQSKCLGALAAAGLSIHFHLPVPPERSGDFDELGRPHQDCWEKEPIDDELLANCLQRAPGPRQLVDTVLELSASYGTQIDALVVGSPEQEVSRYLIERSHLTETPYYAPEGQVLANTSWGRLLLLFLDWQTTGALRTLFELFQHSLFRDWAMETGWPVARLQSALLKLQKDQLLGDVRQLEDPVLWNNPAISLVRETLFLIEETLVRESSSEESFPQRTWSFLQTIAGGRASNDDSGLILNQLEEMLQDLQSDFDPATTPVSDYWEILRYLLQSNQFYPERDLEDRPVSGWLELPWESAPHLVILGLPESQVPGPRNLDSFLTPSLCRNLGLYGPDEMAAFHAFRLRLIFECRRNWGRVDLLLPDRGLDDSPTRHSRFLFLARPDEILNRVNLLLGDEASEELPMPATFGGTITLPEPRPLEKISVTAFRLYLDNPFHFYLQHANRWSPPEPLPRELGPLSFGTLAHATLEKLNGTDTGRTLIRQAEIEAFLMDTLESVATGLFGSRYTIPLQIQLGSMRERLRAAVQHIAAERQAGWIPQRVEWAFNREADPPFSVEGVPVSGKVDLFERNEESGHFRIVDYKSADSPQSAESSHLTKLNARSADPLIPESDFEWNSKQWRWKDLQLPLYQMAVEFHTGHFPACAYFNLPKAVAGSGLNEWMPDPVLRESALRCAQAVIREIRAGRFPLGVKSRYEDPWLKWFGGDYTTTIDPSWQFQYGGIET